MNKIFVAFVTVIGLLLGCGGSYYGLKTDMPLILIAGMSVLALTIVFRLVFGKCPHCGASTLFNSGKYCKECKRRLR